MHARAAKINTINIASRAVIPIKDREMTGFSVLIIFLFDNDNDIAIGYCTTLSVFFTLVALIATKNGIVLSLITLGIIK